MYPNRYIYDPLYGRITLPEFVWKVFTCPELQRLREVRLCNINSLCLPGGANINRYEHALGTAYLANQVTNLWKPSLSKRDQRQIVYAALLHDIGSSAFGHSVEYVLDPQGYKHDSLYSRIGQQRDREEDFAYQHTKAQPIFFGIPGRLPAMLSKVDLIAISDMVAGGGQYGALISSLIDVDNIDNVYRLAYHIGLVRDGEYALQLAKKLSITDNKLYIEDDAEELLHKWYDVRRRLYKFLLLNPDEFSGKCMLEEALHLAQVRSIVSFRWSDVDYELLDKLAYCSDDVSSIVTRLMVGDLFGCAAILSSSRIEMYERFIDFDYRQEVEAALEKSIRESCHPSMRHARVALHVIKDVNKTQRRIILPTTTGGMIEVGEPSKQLLIGVFFENVHLSMTGINTVMLTKESISQRIRNTLARIMDDENLKELVPYDECPGN